MERVLGTPALFATAYGNVGSSIYYALGLTAVYALGLTPLVFVVAGVIFAATAATYAEGTARFPEAGGSASFARHSFDELISFTAGWAQMLVYVVTVAVSAFFVPHYLSVFWEPLNTNPWDIVGGAIVIVVLVAVNVVGVREAAKLSITLAVVDFATQVLLVALGFFLVFSPEILVDNVYWGVAPTWSNLAISIPVAMLAYTGVETVSNLAEEARDPVRTVPNAYKLVAGAVFAIYFTLPLVALSALPVETINGELTTKLALPPEEGGYANDPILGVVENLGIEDTLLDVAQIYVGILAATILFIATNAGVIGASRITYSMASYRQLPEAFRRLHPRFKTPWLSLVLFAGIAPILVILPGDVNFVGTLYSLGATLSFTVAHVSLVRLRMKDRDERDIPYLAHPNLRLGGVSWPLFAIVGAVATGASFLVLVVENPATRLAGLGWMLAGLAGYVVYRRRWVKASVREIVKAPPAMGPALALEYRRLLVPVVAGQPSDAAMDVACRLAAERGARIVAMSVLEVPLDRPLTDELPALAAEANRELDEALAIGDSYGVRVLTRIERAHAAGPAIVEEATARNVEIIVIGSPRRTLTARQAAVFGKTVDYVLKHADCRVLVTAAESA
jgi:basic amino acid/polyamine antiporter, APA family